MVYKYAYSLSDKSIGAHIRFEISVEISRNVQINNKNRLSMHKTHGVQAQKRYYTTSCNLDMPKSKSSTKNPARTNPFVKKARAKRPQVQVTYEDGKTRPSLLSIPKSDTKGKGKAIDEDGAAEDNTDEEEEEEDIKPIIKEEDGDFQKAFEQHIASDNAGTSSASFIIIAGSYEKNLYGIEGTFVTSVEDTSAEPELKLIPSFIFPAHLGCIKSLSVSPGAKWLVTGSEDEYIKVWDLRKRKEVGSLSEHVGSC
jgi:protein MAK11